MRALVWSYTAIGAAGATQCIRRGRPARFAGIPLPGSAKQHAVSIGTPLSPPPFMSVALLAALRADRNEAIRILAVVFTVGLLGEPHTWATLRRPGRDPIDTLCVLLGPRCPPQCFVRDDPGAG
jgi:hypothetical protein